VSASQVNASHLSSGSGCSTWIAATEPQSGGPRLRQRGTRPWRNTIDACRQTQWCLPSTTACRTSSADAGGEARVGPICGKMTTARTSSGNRRGLLEITPDSPPNRILAVRAGVRLPRRDPPATGRELDEFCGRGDLWNRRLTHCLYNELRRSQALRRHEAELRPQATIYGWPGVLGYRKGASDSGCR